MKFRPLFILLLFLLGFPATRGWADTPSTEWGLFQTPIKTTDLDLQAFGEWMDGSEKAIVGENGKPPTRSPQYGVWMQDHPLGPMGLSFGSSKTPGVRHLRVALNSPVLVGDILVTGNVRVSVLKPDATYPGDLGNDSQWIQGTRIKDGKITSDEVENIREATLWVFPPGTQTRALRFSHTAEANDTVYQGTLTSAYVMSDRFFNVATQALAATSSSTEKANRINDSIEGRPYVWENIPVQGDRAQVVSAQSPEWIMLVWPHATTLRGLGFLVPGFATADVQVYQGPADIHPRDATDGNWATLMTTSIPRGAALGTLDSGLSWLDFGKDVTVRALRLRITAPIPEKDIVWHWTGSGVHEKRVWLSEILALQALNDQPLVPPTLATDPADAIPHPPIPVHFSLPDNGYVTLVIEDSTGKRVRNLVSETPFPKGENTVWWDGTDDLARDPEASGHGIYHIPTQFVAPGDYHVRGLWRKDIHAAYEFGVYNNGTPPWDLADHTGAWLSNHCPPMSALYVPADKSPTGQPAVYLGCLLTEGPDGLAWVDLDGHKQGGRGAVGGAWTSAPFMTRDDGPNADPDVTVYVAAVGQTDKREPDLRVTGLTKGPDKSILHQVFQVTPPRPGEKPAGPAAEIDGVAAYNGLVVCSMPFKNQLWFIDTKEGKIGQQVPVDSPRGLVFDPAGKLLVLSGQKLLRLDPANPASPTVVISSGLEDPSGITLDGQGNIYISDRGTSHQVKVFTPAGQFVRAIGNPGVPQAGPYDPLHMNNPQGLAIDSQNHLWVTENDFLPKRTSLWTLDGKFIKAFYGPSKYGGGGSLDPMDKTLFYDADEGRGAMEFKLDWNTGTFQLTDVYYRTEPDGIDLPAAPETALYFQGKRYFTNCYNTNGVSGSTTAFLFQDRNGIARPVAAMGNALGWRTLFEKEEFKSLLPPGIDFTNGYHNNCFFMWIDLNGDGKIEPNEITCQNVPVSGMTVMPDLSFCAANLAGKATRFAPVRFTDQGVPVYDFSKGEVIADGVLTATSSGGNQLLLDDSGNFIDTVGVKPFLQYSLCGGKNGTATWSYPSLWPGLHASHEAPPTDTPGEVIGSTRLMGGFFSVKDAEGGPFWAINGNMGNFYVFTKDGLFVATVFKDVREGKLWRMPISQRGMSLDGITLHDENFWPMISQASDGKVYLVQATCLVRLEGFDSIRTIPPSPLTITADDLKNGRDYLSRVEALHQRAEGRGILEVTQRDTPPKMDGTVDDWTDAKWVEIDKRGVRAWFNSTSKPYDVLGAVSVTHDRLYAAWQTANPLLLQNSGEIPNAPFKTGGALDLMIGTNPDSDPKRQNAVPGDLRLIVTQVKGKTLAVLYRPVAPGTQTPPVPFSSPWRTINFDQVEDVSDQVQLATDNKGTYEISVPLDLLGLKLRPDMQIKGDIGLLRGEGRETLSRTYWSNKAAAIVSDVPSEAELAPSLWGTWQFSLK